MIGLANTPCGAAEGLARALARQTPSKRLAAHRAAAMGYATIEGRLVPQEQAAAAARAALPITPQASAKPRSRIQVVADAVANDPACKGKAVAALALLADDALAAVPGRGLVKILAGMPKGEGAAMLAATNRTNAAHASTAPRTMRPSKASATVWDRAIARNAGKPHADALQGSAKAWGLALSKMEGHV